MTQQRIPKRAVILYPPEFRDALVQAWIARDRASIDLITDQLALRGYARPRNADANPSRKGWQ